MKPNYVVKPKPKSSYKDFMKWKELSKLREKRESLLKEIRKEEK